MCKISGAPLFALICLCVNYTQAAQLVSAAGGSCMNLPEHGDFAPDGTPVRLFHSHDTSNQVWTVSSGQINSSFGRSITLR